MRLKTTLPVLVLLVTSSVSLGQANLLGELKKWHTLRIQFEGPQSSEAAAVNPFLEYRLNVRFTAPDGRTFTVPGFYAADGNAAQTGATSGAVWEVRFTPDRIGTWTYQASFRNGVNIAVDTDPSAGTPVSFDGASGSFTISSSDKSLPDNRARGRLSYVGERYLRFSETGEYFLKAGADSPENLLACGDFDNTVSSKTWQPHVQDWNAGDPVWKDGQGKGIIGAVNYLADKGMNAFSFLTMNVIGDGKDVWPWASGSHSGLDASGGQDEENRTRYDVSKLEQWEILFSHADTRGMYLHFKTQETENDQLLDGGNLGITRKLYYRELIARFGHHLALNWNLGEENDIFAELSDPSNERVKSYASYIQDLDPYNNHIVIHSYPHHKNEVYGPLLGLDKITGPSLQSQINEVHDDVTEWIQRSASSGKVWVVSNDEQGSHQVGVAADADYTGDRGSQADNRELIRHRVLWGTLMAGGAGVEYYFGYETGETDLTAQDWRSRESKWEDARHALDFFQMYLPFTEMESRDQLLSSPDNYCFAKPGSTYAVYLSDGNTDELDLSSTTGSFEVLWYDPAKGGSLKTGGTATLEGGAKRSLGTPPDSSGTDWVVLVRKTSGTDEESGTQDNGECQAAFEELGGMVIMEAENFPQVAGWTFENSANGYTGAGYLEWTGGDSFGTPGNGTMPVSIKIHTPGTYRFQWHSKVGKGTQSTEHNDSWLRFPDAADFYGQKDGSRIYPTGSGKSPNPEGASADGWFKVYISGGTGWNWTTYTSDYDGHDIFVTFNQPGIYTMEISGRSNHHLIDRVTLSLDAGSARDLSLEETPCTASENGEVAVNGVSLDPSEAELAIGEALQLNALVAPANATNPGVTWSSSSPGVASVDENGRVLALTEGETIIEVRTEDGGYTAKAVILVGAGEADSEEEAPGDGESQDPDENPEKPVLIQTSSRALEGETMVFTFRLSQAVEESVRIPLIFENLTASQNDYRVFDKELVFEAGSDSANLEVVTLTDQRMEESETFLVLADETADVPQMELPAVLAMGTILDDDQALQISPNPAAPFSEISFANVQEGSYIVEIFSPSGNLHQRGSLEVDGTEPRLELGDLARGLYIVKLSGPAYSYTAKLIVK